MSFFGIGMNRSFEDMVLYYKMTGVIDVRLMPSWMLAEKNPLEFFAVTESSYFRRKNNINPESLGMKPRHELVNNCKCDFCSREFCSQKNLVVNILDILGEDDVIVPGNEDEIYVNNRQSVNYNTNKTIRNEGQDISTKEHRKWLKWCDDQLDNDYWKKFDVKLTIRAPDSKYTGNSKSKGPKSVRPEIKSELKNETDSGFEFDFESLCAHEPIPYPKSYNKFKYRSEINFDSHFGSKSESSISSSGFILR